MCDDIWVVVSTLVKIRVAFWVVRLSFDSMSWSDQEWKEWRKAGGGQQASSSGAQGQQQQQQQQQQHASPAMPGIGSCSIALPAIWKVDVNPSESHGQKDFAKVRRDCNRQLQKMYNLWQQELEQKREEHAVELRASLANQTTTNNLLLEEKQRTAWLGQQLTDSEAKLVQAHKEDKGDRQNLQMEYESKLLLEQSNFDKAKKELESDMQKLVDQHKEEQDALEDKHAEKIMVLTSKHSAEKKELHSAHRAEVLQMKQETRQMKRDMQQYRKKVTAATTRWAERMAQQKEVVEKMQRKVKDLQREMSLAEDSDAAAATSCFNPHSLSIVTAQDLNAKLAKFEERLLAFEAWSSVSTDTRSKTVQESNVAADEAPGNVWVRSCCCCCFLWSL